MANPRLQGDRERAPRVCIDGTCARELLTGVRATLTWGRKKWYHFVSYDLFGPTHG
jgi:hypothetical protein